MVLFTACSCKLEKEKLEEEIKPLADILSKHVVKSHKKREDVETMDMLKKYLPMKLTPCNDEIAECKRLNRSISTKLYYYKKGKDTFAISIRVGGREIRGDDLLYYCASLEILHHDTHISCCLDKKCEKPHSGLGRGCKGWFKQ